MPPKERQTKPAKYTKESLKQALKDIRDDGKSIRETCRKYNVPRATIQDRLSGRREDAIKSKGPEPILGITGEKQLVEWIKNIAKCGFPVKKGELLDTVQKIVRDLNTPNKFKDGRPGQTWFCNFLKRHPDISLRCAEGINKARAKVTEESIRLWFRDLKACLTEEGHSDILDQPERIFNADESGFSLCPKTGKVLGPKGYRNLYQVKIGNEKDNLTVLITFNAIGQMCPPLIIFPYVRPPKAVVDSMPENWCLGRSESGWMKSDVFFEYLTNDFNEWVDRNGIKKPILLLVDGHKSHMSLMLSTMCEKLGIILYALPPNTTHILQPADVSVFGPMKAHWRTIVRNFLSKPENQTVSVTKSNFCLLFKDLMENSATASNIVNGFRKCGLFPFDPNAVDYTKCVQTTLEDITHRRRATGEITNADLTATRKILKHLGPILKKKKINVNFILREVKKLRKVEPNQSILYETGSEDRTNSNVNLSSSRLEQPNETSTSIQQCQQFIQDDNRDGPVIELNPNGDLNATFCSSPRCAIDEVLLDEHLPEHNIVNSLSTFHIDLGSILTSNNTTMNEIIYIINSQPDQPENFEPTADDLVIPLTEIMELSTTAKQTVLPIEASTPNTSAKNDTPIMIESEPQNFQPATKTSVVPCFDKTIPRQSTSTNLLDVFKQQPDYLYPTADDLDIPQTEIMELSTTPKRTMLPIEASGPNSSAKNDKLIIIDSQPQNVDPATNTLVVPSLDKTTPRQTTSTNPLDVFKQHLYLPEPLKEIKENRTTPRYPASISSGKWREYIERKQNLKSEKINEKITSKLEKKRKQEQKKEEKKIKKECQIKKRKISRKVKEDILKQKCALCTFVLNSDTEDEENKNIGCDMCPKWYHLKCTDFNGLRYDDVKESPFKCGDYALRDYLNRT